MSGSTRRGLLGGGAALAVAPVTLAQLHSDRDLIALCAQLDALEREYLATDFGAMPHTLADDHAEAERDRIAEAQQPIVDAICARPPQTTAGAVAVARSLALWDGDLFRQGGPDGSTNERLVAVLVGSLTGRVGA